MDGWMAAVSIVDRCMVSLVDSYIRARVDGLMVSCALGWWRDEWSDD